MPVYNSPDVFASIDSVLEQSYRPMQFIIADDASDNLSGRQIEEYACGHPMLRGADLRVIKNETNRGTVATLNEGLRLVEGEYLFTLAGDDQFADPEALQRWVDEFERTNADVITARRNDYDAQMQTLTGVSPGDAVARFLREESPAELFERFAGENPISGACTAWRVSALRELGGFDESCRLIEDYPLFLRYLRKGGRIAFFDSVTVNYRAGGGSAEGKAYSDAYVRDMEWIFENEIIPYTACPDRARKRLQRWKADVSFDRRIHAERERNAGKPVRLALLRVCSDLYHPVRTLRRIRKQIKQ